MKNTLKPSAAKSPTLSEIKAKIRKLESVEFAPEVMSARQAVREARRPEIEKLQKQIAELRELHPRKKPTRWPEHTPPAIVDLCKKYWSGSTELQTFRIHLWNAAAVWTSYPAGGYFNNGGWNPTPAAYYLISRTETEFQLGHAKPKQLASAGFERNSGKRVTPALMQAELDKLHITDPPV